MKQQYELEAKLEAKSESLANLMEITKLLASRTITVETNAVAESESKGDIYNQSGSFGVGINPGEIKAEKIVGTSNEAQPKNIAEAAAEIQQLLEQLSQTYPTNTTTEQMIVAAKSH